MYLDRHDDAENSIMQTISIAVSAILIAAGLITAPSLINNARDVNAKGDLANLATAQEFALANTGEYANGLDALKSATKGSKDLPGGVKYTLAGGSDNTSACQDGDGDWHYVSASLSASNKTFYRTDASTKIATNPATLEGNSCLNLPSLPDGSAGNGGTQPGGGGNTGGGGTQPGDGGGDNGDGDDGDGDDGGSTVPVTSLTGTCESGYTFTATDSWTVSESSSYPADSWTAKNLDADGNFIHSDDQPSNVLLQKFLPYASAADGTPTTCRVIYQNADQSATRSGDRPSFLSVDSAYSDWTGDHHGVAKAAWNDITVANGGPDWMNTYTAGHRADSSKPFSVAFDSETGQLLEAQYNAIRVEDGANTINTIKCDGTGFASCSTDNASQDDVFTQARYNAIGTLASYPELAALAGK